MSRSSRTPPIFGVVLAVALVVAAALAACGLVGSGGSCACGASTSDPLAVHDVNYAGQHLVASECVCQCGEDDHLFARPKDRECTLYADTCTTTNGRRAQLVCY